ncbi:hypothetical protein FACS1894176_07640 [Bacteroidia bacterium]|nr:hypothetical protein FACS1894176_07640 [Bacteroidia bacterium]
MQERPDNLTILKMATFDQLQIYKQAYDLTVELMQLSKKMDRGYKFTFPTVLPV